MTLETPPEVAARDLLPHACMRALSPAPLRAGRTFADRFWSVTPWSEVDDLPEPERSIAIVRHAFAVLERVQVGNRWPGGVAGMLRDAQLDGDLAYASPEQLRGDPIGIRAVVFSVGVALFERLTGHHPFGAENDDERQVERIRRGEMGSGVNHFPRLAAGLRAVLVRAMWPVPEERWAHLGVMRERLAHFVDTAAGKPDLPGTVPAARFDPASRDVISDVVTFDRTLASQVDPLGPTLVAAIFRGPLVVRDVVVEIGPAVPAAAVPLPLQAPADSDPVAAPPQIPETASDADPTLTRPVAGPTPVSPAESAAAVPPRAASRRAPAGALVVIGGAIAGASMLAGFLLGRRHEPAAVAAKAVAAMSQVSPPPAVPPAAAPASPTPPPGPPAPPSAERPLTRQEAASTIASCFDPSRAVSFGLTLLVTPSGTIRKVFFDRAALVPDERRCIGERLRGASYRGMTGLVELHARVDASGPSLRAARPARKGR